MAGESGLTTTYQPLDTLGGGGIAIVSVTCHHWYGMSGVGSAVDLIAVANVPPTDNPKEATENLNLASVCGVTFSTNDLGDDTAPLKVTMNLSKFVVPERFGHPREDVVRACLECLRRCLPEKLLKTPVTLEVSEADKEWVVPIVKEFNAHDRGKVFFTPEN